MNHWISLYSNPTSTRRTTAKLKKLPAEASAKFQATQKKIEAFRDVNGQYEVNSITTLENEEDDEE
ncbi:hypothetical protein PS15m_005836 [Mucor circinelloides]